MPCISSTRKRSDDRTTATAARRAGGARARHVPDDPAAPAAAAASLLARAERERSAVYAARHGTLPASEAWLAPTRLGNVMNALKSQTLRRYGVTAQGRLQWTRTLVRTAVGNPNRSPFVRTTKAKVVKVKLDRKLRYELDSGRPEHGQVVQGRGEAGALKVQAPRRDEETA